MCLYDGQNFTGEIRAITPVLRFPSAAPQSLGSFKHRATSWYNNTSTPLCLLDESDPTITVKIADVPPNTGANGKHGTFGINGFGTEDRADAVSTFCPREN